MLKIDLFFFKLFANYYSHLNHLLFLLYSDIKTNLIIDIVPKSRKQI